MEASFGIQRSICSGVPAREIIHATMLWIEM